MDYLVSKTPEECLAMTERHFGTEWPYRGHVTRTEARVSYVESQEGCLAFLFAGQPGGVNVYAVPEGDTTRITVTASQQKYDEAIDAYLRGIGATPAGP